MYETVPLNSQGNGFRIKIYHNPTFEILKYSFPDCRLFDHRLLQKLQNIFCKRTLLMDNCDPILHIRLQLLRLQMAIEIEDFEMANDLLNHINPYFFDAIECIHLPNQMFCKLVDRWTIGSEMKLIKCLQLLQSHQRQQWHRWQMQQSALEMLLTHRQCNFNSKYLNIFQQIEMLVEWHWYAERFDECLRWCEIGLNESIRIWVLQCKRNNATMPVTKEFLQHIRFLTVYLEYFVDENQNGMYGI